MRLLAIGDIHGETQRLARTLSLLDDVVDEIALVLLTGDLTAEPADRQQASVLAVLDQVCDAFPAAPVCFVPGNHDLPTPPEHARAINLDGTRLTHAGLALAGFGGAGPARFGFPYEWSEAEADARLTPLLVESPDLWLCHTPPRDTPLDVTMYGSHVGSASVLRWIAQARPQLFVCGHIHEALGVAVVEGVPCLNAGALGKPYGRDVCFLVDWDDGPARIARREWLGQDRRVQTAWQR